MLLNRNELYTLEWALEDRVRSLNNLIIMDPDDAADIVVLRDDAEELRQRVRGEHRRMDDRLNQQVADALNYRKENNA